MPSTPSAATTDELRRLIDLEEIRTLIASFARSIDTKDQARYAATFVEDGVVELPFGTRVGRAEIAAMKGPPPGTHSHHLFGQIDIDLHGDTATSVAYMMATHVFSPDALSEKAHSGGWYEQELVRTEQGWRFTKVRLEIRWADERPMIPPHPTTASGPDA